MDRLLRYFLVGQFIRRGTMIFTTGSGASFACGDGTGLPVSSSLSGKASCRLPQPNGPRRQRAYQFRKL